LAKLELAGASLAPLEALLRMAATCALVSSAHLPAWPLLLAAAHTPLRPVSPSRTKAEILRTDYHPTMNKDELTAEIENLKARRDAAVANVHALNGAIEFAEYMRTKCEVPQVEADVNAP
jgi:hypothetical protein